MTKNNLKYKKVMKKIKFDGPTDGRTDGQMDKTGCRVACTRPKTFFAILCQLKRSGIPIFFSFYIVIVSGVFDEKMVMIYDDVFIEK